MSGEYKRREPLVSLLLLATNPTLLRTALEAIVAAEDPALPTELVLVLNRCDESVDELVATTVPDALVVRSDYNTGTTVAWNIAAELASAPFLATLHEDTQIRPGWLPPLLAAHARDPVVRVVGPRQFFPDGQLLHDGWVLWSDGEHSLIDEVTDPGTLDRTEPRDVDFLSSAAMLFDREIWRDAGGFDERYYPAIFADVDFCSAVWARGGAVANVPQSTVVHATGAMLKGEAVDLRRALQAHLLARNRSRFQEKWAGFLPRHIHVGDLDWHGRHRPEPVARALERLRTKRAQPTLDPPPRADRSLTVELRRSVEASGERSWKVADELGLRLLDAELATQRGLVERLHEQLVDAHEALQSRHDDVAHQHEIIVEQQAVLDRQEEGLAHQRAMLEHRDTVLDERRRLTDELSARIAAADAELNRLRERDRTLQRIVSGRWWRLRNVLRRFVPGWR